MTNQNINPKPQAQPVDPRQGHTSASNAAADALCPGRHLAQRGSGESKSLYADAGQRIHAALAKAGGAVGDQGFNRAERDSLSVEERQTFTDCMLIQRKLCAEYFGPNVSGSNYREFREQRYWTKFKANGVDYAHSGQADFVARMGTKVLVIDYKTMPGEVAESSRNLQLRDLACLVRGNLIPTDEVAVAIVQPAVTHTPELCIYGNEDLARATKEMFQRVVASNQESAKRVAGEVQCRYCRARGYCAEYQAWAGRLLPATTLDLKIPVLSWNPQQRAAAAAALAPCEKFLAEVKEALKIWLSKDPNAVPGWELKPGAMRESITNPQGVFERFAALGGKVEQFMPCVDVVKGRLKEALNNLTGAKGKQLDAAMKTLTDGLVEAKQSAPSLKRKGDA